MAHRNRLSNARVFVFGGTSGIGFAAASLAASQGAFVIISGSKQPKVDDKVALLRSYYPSNPSETITGHAVDLLDSENLEANLTALFDKVTDRGEKKLDHIVFTAGDFMHLPKIDAVTIENAMAGFPIRFLAPVIVGKLVATKGYVANIATSSITLTGGTNSKKPMKGWALGAAWGATIEGLVRGLAVDLAPIRVNLVRPGAVNTELLQGFFAHMDEEAVENLTRQAYGLLGALGEPGDVAEAYGYFMRDINVTGEVATTDGGRKLVGGGAK